MLNAITVQSDTGSVFLNNRTQSVRLKRSVRFDNIEQRLVAFKVYDEESDVIFLTESSVHEPENWKMFEAFLSSNKLVLKETKDVSLFLNNKTQAVRIPASMAFSRDEKQVSVDKYIIGDGKVDELNTPLTVLKLTGHRG